MAIRFFIKNEFKKHFSNEIFIGLKNTSFLIVGQIITQAIGLISVPIIARKLGVENYGILATVTSFIGMFAILNFKGTRRVLVREGSKDLSKLSSNIEDIIGLKNVFAILSIIFTIAVALFIQSYSTQIKLFIAIYSFTHVISIYDSFLGTIYQSTQKMKYIAIWRIIRKLLYSISTIIALYLGAGVLTIILISIISNSFVLFLNFLNSRKLLKFKLVNPIKWRKDLVNPSIVFSIISVLGFFQTRIDLLMISWMGSTIETGIYAVAFNVCRYLLIVQSKFSVAFFPIFVKRFNDGPVRLINLIKLSIFLFSIVFVFAIIFSLFAQDLTTLLFGAEYRESGKILSVLLFYIAFGFMLFPFGNAFMATGNEKTLLSIDILATIMNIGTNYLFYNKYGLIGIAYSTLLVVSTMTLLRVALIIYFLKKQGRVY